MNTQVSQSRSLGRIIRECLRLAPLTDPEQRPASCPRSQIIRDALPHLSAGRDFFVVLQTATQTVSLLITDGEYINLGPGAFRDERAWCFEPTLPAFRKQT